MQRADSLEKTLMLGKAEGRRRRGRKRMRWLNSITDSVDMSLRNSRRWWRTGKLGMLQSMGLQMVWHNWVTEQQVSSQRSFPVSLMISSLIHWLFTLFAFYVFANIPVFLLLLIYSFIPLWPEKIVCMSSIFLNVLRIVLEPDKCLSWGLSHMRPVCLLVLWGLLWSGPAGWKCGQSPLFLSWSSFQCSFYYWKWIILFI